MEQLSLFESKPASGFITRVKYDPYWDEVTREPDDELLMVVNGEETTTTISNSPKDELLMVVEDDQLLSTTISKRTIGNGTGRITTRKVSKNGKDYKQYWYDWQYYQGGKLIGRSRYIPKRLLPQIMALEQEKVPVTRIIEILGGKN